MSQLIALIIAIALGAIVTAIGYVFLGDAFTDGSSKGVALQFVNQASQLEMALIAYRAINSASAFDTDMATTMSRSGDTEGLIPERFIKSELSAPLGLNYTLLGNNGDIYLFAQGTEINLETCNEVNKLLGATTSSWTIGDPIIGNDFDSIFGMEGKPRYICFSNFGYTEQHIFSYKVE